jgi:glycosyltransferase involved in cell wall biosynthesis
VPLLTLVLTMLPISFADWGTREFVALLVLASTGLAAEDLVAISLLVGATNLICALPGLYFAARGKGKERGHAVRQHRLHVVVPGRLDQLTGGFLYDARMVAGLRGLGWEVEVHEVPGSFPDADEVASAGLSAALAALPDDARVVIDGLAMGGLPGPVLAHAERLRILALIHHPLADETGLSPEEKRRFATSERAALAACRGVVATSPFTAGRLEEYGVPERAIRAVPPGTEAAPLAEGPDPGASPRLICVGTVTPRKGHDVLVAALERVRHLSWTCVCVGSLDRDRGYAERVLEQVAEADLTARIELVGERSAAELDELYHGASIFVLASHYEGYGMALAQALARGLPVVSTTGGAIPFTAPADASVLVEPGDDIALAQALGSLIEEPSRRAALAAAARRHSAELPSWEESVSAFAAAVEELAS